MTFVLIHDILWRLNVSSLLCWITSCVFLCPLISYNGLSRRGKNNISGKCNFRRVYLWTSSYNGRWPSIIMGNSEPEQTVELLNSQRNKHSLIFFSLRWPHSVLLKAEIKYNTHNKDYCLVHFAFPLNISVLTMAALFSAIETSKCLSWFKWDGIPGQPWCIHHGHFGESSRRDKARATASSWLTGVSHVCHAHYKGEACWGWELFLLCLVPGGVCSFFSWWLFFMLIVTIVHSVSWV